jgi:hypothetical protein
VAAFSLLTYANDLVTYAFQGKDCLRGACELPSLARFFEHVSAAERVRAKKLKNSRVGLPPDIDDHELVVIQFT